MNRKNERSHAMLEELASQRFFGNVVFQFKAGEVALIRKEETILPTETPDKPNNGRTGDRDERNK